MGSFCAGQPVEPVSFEPIAYVLQHPSKGEVTSEALQGEPEWIDESILEAVRPVFEGLRERNARYLDERKIFEVQVESVKIRDHKELCTFERASSLSQPNGDPHRPKQSQFVRTRLPDQQNFAMLLCFLADNPTLLRSILLVGPNPFGLYAVKVRENGKPRILYIDDHVLCSSESTGKQPLFAQPTHSGIWPCLLEKAWIGLKSASLQTIASFDVKTIFESFLCLPLRSLRNDSGRDLKFSALLKAQFRPQDGWVMIPKTNQIHNFGINNRPFYLLALAEVGGQTYFIVRDPSEGEYRGENFTPSPELLEASARKAIHNQSGIFFLSENEVDDEVEEVVVCESVPNAFCHFQGLQLAQEADQYFRITAPHATMAALTLRQYS